MTPTKKITAKVGPMPNMKEEVISAWFEPSSKLTSVYEVQLRADGILSCNCPGWVNQSEKRCPRCNALLQKQPNGLLTCKNCMRTVTSGDVVKVRKCKHCTEHLSESQEILDGKKPRVFKQDPDLVQKLLMRPNVGSPEAPKRRRLILTEAI